MKKFWQEFKEFISKGNIVDLAIGIVVGTAFSKIVSSLVNDIIMPLFGALLGQNSFADLKWVIRAATDTTSELALRYGAFLQSLLDFFIIALSVFIALKIMIRSQQKIKEASQNLIEDIKKLSRKQKKQLKTKSDSVSNENVDKNEKDISDNQKTQSVEEKKVVQTTEKPAESVEDILRDIRDSLKK